MKARMEPLGSTFRRFARTVRDLAAQLGKSARLAIEGEDVEVDAKVDRAGARSADAPGQERSLPRHRVARGSAAQGKDPCGLVRLGPSARRVGS